jgi:hypothetical protein
MLAYSDSANITLDYQKPFDYIFAAVCTFVMVTVAMVILMISFFGNSRKNN